MELITIILFMLGTIILNNLNEKVKKLEHDVWVLSHMTGRFKLDEELVFKKVDWSLDND